MKGFWYGLLVGLMFGVLTAHTVWLACFPHPQPLEVATYGFTARE